MQRFLLGVCLFLGFAAIVQAQGKAQGFCQNGGTSVIIPGTQGSGSQRFQQSFPSCTVTVYAAGTTNVSTIYADNALTAKANPFTAATNGQWFFYAANGNYDIKFSGGGIPSPFTLGSFNVGGIRVNCAIEAGTTFGAQFATAASLLPTTGGIVDCSNLQGAQSITADPFTAVTKPILLIWPTGTASSSISLTIPATMTVDFPEGGILSMAVSTTATVNGEVRGTLSTHFAGAGVFSMHGIVAPEWWGSVCNGVVDDVTGIQGAVSAITNGSGGVVRFQGGYTCIIKSAPFAPYSVALVPTVNPITLEFNGTTITDTLASSGSQALFGRTFPISYEAATGYAVSINIATGGTSLTLTTPAQAANFAVGDAVYIRTGPTVDGATNSEINQVESANVGTGIITFRWPTSKALVNDGVHPFVVADVQSSTGYNLTIQNVIFKSHVLPLAIGSSINTTVRNLQSYTIDNLIPGPPTIQADHVRSFLIDHWSVYLPHSCVAALYQLAVSIDVSIQNSSLVSNDVACTLLNFSDFSAQTDVHDNYLGGVGQIAGSLFNDVNIHDNIISINTQTGLPPIDLEVGGSNNPGINFHSNRMNFPGTSPSLVIGGPQFRFTDNTILSGSTARVLSITSNASAGTGGVITSNTITCTAGCTAIEVDGTIHDQVISGNNLKGPGLGTGIGIAVANSNITTTSNTITSNTIAGFANGVLITTVANEPLITILGNNVSNTTTPFSPNTFNTAGLVAWGAYTPTLTGVANVSSSTPYQAQWMRVGNAVTVSGRFDVTATAAGPTATQLGISQPAGQTSVFTAPNECGGMAMANNNGTPLIIAAAILANVATGNCEANWNALDLNAHGVWYQYTYRIRPP